MQTQFDFKTRNESNILLRAQLSLVARYLLGLLDTAQQRPDAIAPTRESKAGKCSASLLKNEPLRNN